MPFNEHRYTFSRTKALATLVACASVTAFALSFVEGLYPLGNLAGPLSAIAAVVWIRSYFCDMSRLLRETFNAGRELGRAEERVEGGDNLRPLR